MRTGNRLERGDRMLINKRVFELMKYFPSSTIDANGVLCLSGYAELWFSIKRLNNENDLIYAILEECSQKLCKDNESIGIMRKKINEYLGVSFTREEWERIYKNASSGCGHKKIVLFVSSDYNFKYLEDTK